MKISKDIIFIDYGEKKKVIVYNYFVNRAVMVGEKTGKYLKDNIGKKIGGEDFGQENEKILINNGILYEMEDEYEKSKFEIEYPEVSVETVYFHVTQRCNLNCTYCYNKHNLNNRDELNTEEILVCLNKLASIGVKTINFTGGEALLRTDIIYIVKMAKKLGFKVCLLTNGTLLQEKISILDAVDRCMISVDNIDAELNSLTRKGSDKYHVIETLAELPDFYKEKITVRSVVTRGREKFIQKNRDYFQRIGIKYVANACLPNDLSDVKNVPRLIPEFVEVGKNQMCGAGRSVIAIDSNGDIYPCQTFIDENYRMGNILEKEWYYILRENGKKSELVNLRLEEKTLCKSCEYKYLCLGGCPNLSYKVYKDIKQSNAFLCELYKENARQYLISLFEDK